MDGAKEETDRTEKEILLLLLDPRDMKQRSKKLAV